MDVLLYHQSRGSAGAALGPSVFGVERSTSWEKAAAGTDEHGIGRLDDDALISRVLATGVLRPFHTHDSHE